MQPYFIYGGVNTNGSVYANTWHGYHVAILVRKSFVKNGDINYGEEHGKKKSVGDENPHGKTPDFIRFNPITKYRPFINSAMGRGVLYTIFTSIDDKRHACS